MQRKRTVGYQNRERFGYPRRQTYQVPALTLSGNWLRDAGFEYGQKVTVLVEKGKIVIEL